MAILNNYVSLPEGTLGNIFYSKSREIFIYVRDLLGSYGI